MPVAIKLSKKFYDRFGDDVVSELVDLLNQVDATYKSELKGLIDAHFARFDAKLEQRLAEVRSELGAELKLTASKVDAELKLTASKVDAELKLTASKVELSSLEQRMNVGFADTRTAIEKGLKEQTHFFFLAWAALLVSNIALWFR